MLGEGDKVVYETAKSAVVGLTRSFAQEYGKYNIRTNSVYWIGSDIIFPILLCKRSS